MLRIAVLSDIHAHAKNQLGDGEDAPSYAEVTLPDDPQLNPFSGVRDLILREGITTDVIVCAGDMGDKANPEAVRYSWSQIQTLQSSLSAPLILAATGNHDMDSRNINGFDAKATLQELTDYPFASEALNNEYWANNAVVQSHGSFRSVLLNSSAYHGYSNEHTHGRISSRTRSYIKRKLADLPDPGVNILVTHHQVYKYGAVDLKDLSEMHDASALLDDLNSGEHGSWLLIHGHRHWPAVTNAGGGRGAPVVFSAGSFSAVLYAEIQSRARNQFYILELEETQPGFPIRGTFRAWDWIVDRGFLPAQERSGLTHVGGFGGAMNGAELAAAVNHFYERAGSGYQTWEDVAAAVPDARFTMPSDFEQFQRVLKNQYGLTVLQDGGVPAQVGRA